MTQLPPVIFVMGPTASGKTDLAMTLQDHLPVELISVDSALIYRGMDIGTAKPSSEELRRHPHRLIDILDPAEAYSAESFRVDALKAIADSQAVGRIPLLVGGTMLYFRSLEYGLSRLPRSQPALRRELQQEMECRGLAALHVELARVDPVAAERIHPNDPQRILRALEVQRQTGRSLTELQAEQQAEPFPYRVIKLVRSPQERLVLHERIDRRFDAMLRAGFEQEVRELMDRGDLHPGLPSMRAVGYRQMWEYLSGDIDHADMLERGKVATRQLAKRQITWLRSEKDTHWLMDGQGDVLQGALRILEAEIGT